MATTTQDLRADVADAIEASEPLTDEQLRELLRYSAALLGMSVESAVSDAKSGKLPKNAVGFDIESIVRMLGL